MDHVWTTSLPAAGSTASLRQGHSQAGSEQRQPSKEKKEKKSKAKKMSTEKCAVECLTHSTGLDLVVHTQIPAFAQ